MSAHYLNNQNVKARINEKGKQASREFMHELDLIVQQIIDVSCRQWNGAGKRLTNNLIPKKYK